MKIAKKRCKFCHEWFSPDPRTAYKQSCCAKVSCQKLRRANTQKKWRLKNPSYDQSRKEKLKVWAKGTPSYWQRYRRSHPAYVARDNQRRCSAYQQGKISAKQDQISQISVAKLESIKKMGVVSSAKQDQINRRVNEVVDFLIWKEFSAKQNEIASVPGHERECEYATANLG